VRRDLNSRIERRDLDSGDEWEALQTMALERDSRLSSSPILFRGAAPVDRKNKRRCRSSEQARGDSFISFGCQRPNRPV